MNKLEIILSYPNINWNRKVEFSTSWSFHPYNLGLIAAMTEKKHNVSIVDATFNNLTQEQFASIIRKEKPDVLGISMLASEYRETISVAAKIAKQASPKTKIVAGGISVLTDPYFFVDDKNIDYLVRGEGEYIFKDLCNFFSGEGDLPQKGILYKENGEIIDKGRVDFIEDLDALPFPAYHLVDFKKYGMKIQRDDVGGPKALPYARLLTSRGCPFNCCFCEIKSIAGPKIRFRSAENVLEEIDWLIKEYGIKSVVVDDDNFLFDKKRVKKIFKEVAERNYDIKWSIPGAAVYAMDEEMIKLMGPAGVKFINIAIESGNERVLKEIIRKPINLKYAEKMIKEIRKNPKFELAANFVIGFPGETWDEIRQTLKYAEDIDIDYAKIFIATPMPNTELYKTAKAKGYLLSDYGLSKHLQTRGWIETPEFRAKDLQILRAYEWDRINFSNPEKRKKIAEMMGVSEERLNETRRKTLNRVLNNLRTY